MAVLTLLKGFGTKAPASPRAKAARRVNRVTAIVSPDRAVFDPTEVRSNAASPQPCRLFSLQLPGGLRGRSVMASFEPCRCLRKRRQVDSRLARPRKNAGDIQIGNR